MPIIPDQLKKFIGGAEPSKGPVIPTNDDIGFPYQVSEIPELSRKVQSSVKRDNWNKVFNYSFSLGVANAMGLFHKQDYNLL